MSPKSWPMLVLVHDACLFEMRVDAFRDEGVPGCGHMVGEEGPEAGLVLLLQPGEERKEVQHLEALFARRL